MFPSVNKPLIAMAHLAALPGTPGYDPVGGIRGVIDDLRRDVAVLCDVGFDGILFCNENDRPYELRAGLASSAVMARVIAECIPPEVVYGADFLWDEQCGLAVAVATGAAFMRAVVGGVWESDMGLWQPDGAALHRERRRLDADDLAIFANVTPEFASSTGRRPPEAVARSIATSGLPDAILVSGAMAGDEPELATIAAVRNAVPPEVPVFLNTGAKASTIASYLAYADGCIVGSYLKVDGITWNPVDRDRAKRFLESARAAS